MTEAQTVDEHNLLVRIARQAEFCPTCGAECHEEKHARGCELAAWAREHLDEIHQFEEVDA